jgi:ribulose-bisphosphate carboxylase large chain
MKDRVLATYLIESPLPLDVAAEALAGEQSTGTFVAVPGETEALRQRFRARVERLTVHEVVDSPSLPGARVPGGSEGGYQRGEVTLSFPLENMGLNLPALLSTVAGNLFELRELSGVRLLDVDLPDAFAAAYPGPQFGIAGTRALVGVHGRPLIGTIIKPSIGLTPEETAALVRALVEAGIDFIKDDELMANPPHSRLDRRVAAVMRVIDEAADRTGKKAMYAFNITDNLDAMLRHHDTVQKAGGTCVMVSVNSVGLAGVDALRRRAALPLHGHRNGWGMLTRAPSLGMSFTVYQKIWRLIGVDHLHVNGLQNKFWEPDDSVIESIRTCLTPLFGGYTIMPVISSGQWGGQAPETYRRTGTVDLLYLAGGGILAHPGGPKAGVIGIRQAWEAAIADIPLEQYARDHVELRQTIEQFGASGRRTVERS